MITVGLSFAYYTCGIDSWGMLIEKTCNNQILFLYKMLSNLLFQNVFCFKQKQLLEVFYKKGVFKHFAEFTAKHLCQTQIPVNFEKFLRTTFIRRP